MAPFDADGPSSETFYILPLTSYLSHPTSHILPHILPLPSYRAPTGQSSETLAIASDDNLIVGSVDEIRKLHIRTFPLREQPRRIAHLEHIHAFAVLTGLGVRLRVVHVWPHTHTHPHTAAPTHPPAHTPTHTPTHTHTHMHIYIYILWRRSAHRGVGRRRGERDRLPAAS